MSVLGEEPQQVATKAQGYQSARKTVETFFITFGEILCFGDFVANEND